MFFITSSSSLIFFTYITWTTLTTANGVKWPTVEQEALDEAHDIEIIKAVQTSMSEWKIKSHKHRRKRADKSVCYGDLGCFEDSGPFGYLEMLPSTPKEIDTKFLIYSTKNRGDRPVLEFSYFDMSSAWGDGDLNINNNNLNNNNDGSNSTTQPTTESSSRSKISAGALVEDLGDLGSINVRVIAHGFGSSCSHVWIYEMRTALMAVEDCIVICIDWENGATLPNYVRAAANTRLVGKQLAMLLNGMVDYNGLNMSRVHIIGFSLGAHVAGFAGAELPHLSRITGLDPAGPLFESQHPKVRLDSTDATFVDVIHSNGENLILGGLGSWQPMGHVDFYPNGGRVQHGCSNLFVGAVTDFIWSPAASIEGRSLCNHRRAYKFFIDSVAPRCLFPAFPCDSYDNFLQGKCFPCDQTKENATSHCGNMGYYADRSTGLGQLYLVTREEEPFCAHQYNVELHSSENDLPLRTLGRLEVTLEGDGGLNETFTITEKDDTEFFAGEIISRILVPHPALGFPTRMTLTYKAYSGWLSRGLHNWSVYKVMLTDSFGKSYSLCKRSFNLGTGVSIKLELLPGNCEIPEEIKFENVIDNNTTDIDRYDKQDETTNKNIIKLDENHKIVKNYSYVFTDKSNLVNIPWQPMLEGNSLIEKDNIETSRSFATSDDQQNGEIYEPILKDRKIKIHKERKLHIRESDITEPILKSTTPKLVKPTNYVHIENVGAETVKTARSDNIVNKRGRESRLVTVQLFPFRLGELLERAERYARQTLLPLITVQAPRFLGFGVPTDNDDDRDAKSYPIPDVKSRGLRKNLHLDDGENYKDETTYFPGVSDLTTEGLNPTDDNLIPDSTQKNLFELLRENNNSPRVIQQRSISTDYYTNLNLENPETIKPKRVKPTKLYKDFDDEDDSKEVGVDLKMVKIDLPTYKPPIGFPYLFEVPLDRNSDEYSYENSSPVTTTTEKSKFIPLIYATNDEQPHITFQDKTIRSR